MHVCIITVKHRVQWICNMTHRQCRGRCRRACCGGMQAPGTFPRAPSHSAPANRCTRKKGPGGGPENRRHTPLCVSVDALSVDTRTAQLPALRMPSALRILPNTSACARRCIGASSTARTRAAMRCISVGVTRAYCTARPATTRAARTYDALAARSALARVRRMTDARCNVCMTWKGELV